MEDLQNEHGDQGLFGNNPSSIHDAYEDHVRSKKFTDPELFQTKEKCFRTLLKVASLEDDFQFLHNEIEGKALFLTKEFTTCNHRAEELTAITCDEVLQIHQNCISSVKSNWEWLTAVSKCIPVHLQHASDYHQFFHQAEHVLKGLNMCRDQCGTVLSTDELLQVSDVLRKVKAVTGAVLQHQTYVEKLVDKSKEILPLRYRRELPDFPVKVKSLLSFTHGDFSVNEGDECTILDNSNQISWLVRNGAGVEDEIPPVILVLSSLCKEAIDASSHLRKQMVALWDTVLKITLNHLIVVLTTNLHRYAQPTTFHQLSRDDRNDILLSLRDLIEEVPLQKLSNKQYERFADIVESFIDVISETNSLPTDADIANDFVNTVKSMERMTRAYQDMEIYAKHYLEIIDNSSVSGSLLVKDTKDCPIYKSSAYMKKLPTSDSTEKPDDMLYICEKSIESSDAQSADGLVIPFRRPIRVTVTTEIDDEIFTVCTVQETTRLVISGVKDPSTDKYISLDEAITKQIIDQTNGLYCEPGKGKGITINEAVKQQKILIQEASTSTDYQKQESKQIKTKIPSLDLTTERHIPDTVHTVTGVYDTKSGKVLNVLQAVRRGIIDPYDSGFISTADGAKLTFQEALLLGYIIYDKVSSYDPFNDETSTVDVMEASTGPSDYEVDSVLDPRTKYRVSLPYAISKGIILPTNEEYRNPETGEYMSLTDAINKGVVKATKVKPGSNVKAIINLLQLHDTGATPVRYLLPRAKQDPSVNAYKAISKYLDTSVKAVINHEGEHFSLREAYQNGLIKFDSLSYVQSDGSLISLEEAAQKELVTMPVMQSILGACKKLSLQGAIDSKKISADGSSVFTGNEVIPLIDAVTYNKLDPYGVFFRDKKSGKLMSLGCALDENIINPEQGKTLEMGLASGDIIPSVSPSNDLKESFVVERLTAGNKKIKIKHPLTGELLSLREAFTAGIYDAQHAEIIYPDKGRRLSLSEAVLEGLISKDDAKALYDAMDKMSLQQAMNNNMLNGEWYNPDTKINISLQDAINEGHLIPETVFFVDQASGRITTLACGIQDGLVDGLEGSFLSNSDLRLDEIDALNSTNLNNGSVPISDAVSRKIISPEIKSWRFLEETAPLIDFINGGAVNDKTLLGVMGDVKVPVKDALASKLAGLQTSVCLNPVSGELSLSDPSSQLLLPLLKIPELIELLSDVELAMAKEAKPAENLDDIAKQLITLQDLQATVSNKKAEIDELTNQAQKLLEIRPDGQRTELQQQQYQQLRIAASDLKATYEKVNKQNKAQQKRLQTMKGFLQEHKEKQDSFNNWMKKAQDQMDGFENTEFDLENLQERANALERFQEEINQQDSKILGMQTTCFKFMAEANEYEKALDAYRETIHKPLPKDEVNLPEPRLQSATEAASEEYKQLKAANNTNKEEVEQNLEKVKVYKELDDQFCHWLTDTEDRLNAILTSADSISNPEVANCLTDSLSSIAGEINLNQKTLAKLQDAAAVLSNIYSATGQPEKAEELNSKMAELSKNIKELKEKTINSQKDLNEKFIKSQDLAASLQGVFECIDVNEQEIDKEFKVSLDTDKLKQQIIDNQKLQSSLNSSMLKLEAISKESSDPVITNSRDRLLHLQEEVLSRSGKLDDMNAALSKLGNNVEQFEQWIVSAVQDLQGKAATADPISIRSHFEELYEEKKQKQPELDNIKQTITELLDEPDTRDKSNVRDLQSDVCSKWHDFTELLIDLIVMQTLRDIEELYSYFINCEHSLLKAAPITISSEDVQSLLRDHKAFHEKLESKRDNAMEVIQKCSQMLRETTKEEGDIAKGRLEHVRSLIGSVWKLSSDRLHLLEEGLPLVQHFIEHHSDIGTWLDEICNEVASVGSTFDNPEQIKKQQDALKVSLRYIDDHRPLIEDINNTGQEVKVLCPPDEADRIQNLLDKINSKYDDVKTDIRNRLNSLAEGLLKSTSEVQEALDGMICELNHLHNQIDGAEPIAATVEKIMDQIQENKAIMEDTADRQQAIQSIKRSAEEVIAKVKEQEISSEEDKFKIDVDEIEQKIHEMETLNDVIKEKTVERGRSLEDALAAAKRFWDIYNDLMANFRDIQDSINSQDSPQAETELIQEQDKEHREISLCLQQAIPQLEEVKKMSEVLTPLIGECGKIEVSRSVEEANDIFEEIGDILNERQVSLKEAMERASQFEEEIESVLNWLPKLEETLGNMGPVALDIRSIKIQIEEVKILKLQAVGKCVAIEGVNSSVQALKNKSPVAAENFVVAVEDINSRWNKLVDGIFDREQSLQDSLLRLGELDTSLEDVNGYLQQVEDELSELDHVHGDPKFLETHIKKLKMIQDDIDNQESVIKTLNTSITELSVNDVAMRHSPLLDKQEQMNELWKSITSMLKDKKNKMQEKLTGVKSYLGEIEDVVNWLGDFDQTLKAIKTIGALPDTAQKQCEKFNEHLIQLNAKNDVAHSLLTSGEEMLQKYNCHPFQTVQIRSSLAKLKRSVEAAKKQAKKKKTKLQEHLQNVTGFHSVMKIFTDWLINGETGLSKLKTPSKLVKPIEQQIRAHRDFQTDVEAHKEIVDRLDRTGTYLKYYGAKHDAIVIRNQLLSIKLRWKRLLWKTEERGRILNSAYKEDKRFADDWQSLIEWLDQTKESLSKMMDQRPSPARIKEIIEEIKIARKHPRYYSTTRLGRNLKDRCTRSDPERDVLHKMLEELRTKWTSLRTELSQKQTQLDSQLLESGRLLEASKSLIDWLEKSEESLSDKHPIRGDQDTVTNLIEQHKAFQEELDSRRTTLNTLQQTANPEDPTVLQQLNVLNDLWNKVENLSNQREVLLKENLNAATEFQTAVNALRDFLPQAEQELKFQPLPEHELAIMQLMERHERFEEQLQKMVPNVEKIKELGQQIMDGCHPNAVRFVKYYITITHTRWEQLLERSKARRKRLEDALEDIQGSMKLLEDLLAYLSDAEVLLLTKEEDETPEDLALVEDLLKQHAEFHEELQEKGKEVEKFSSLQTDPARFSGGYTPKLKTVQRELLDPSNPMVTQLLNRWRGVWKLSVDRKKRLQDYLEHLLELESVRNFDFELWRQRYLAWVKTKKARITDFFRKQNKNEDGTINRDEFITGMLDSKFPTNKAELNAVFNIFDRDKSGAINYREFIEALRPSTSSVAKKPKRLMTEQELVHDEIEREVSTCKCRSQFKVEKVESGKYRFGESQKMVLVRFLNSTVMVRVGGGWETLQKFLENHDPCKAKGRTNTELREQLILADGVSQSRASFSSRRHVSGQNSNAGSDAGYSSAGSSTAAAGNKGNMYSSAECLSGTPRRSLSAMHRSKVAPAQSMVNLSTDSSLYGSSTSLASRKGAMTPTPTKVSDGRATPVRRKASTPTPRSVARTPPPHR